MNISNKNHTAIISSKESDFYQKLRQKIQTWLAGKGAGHKFTEYILMVPDFFCLICRLAVDNRVPLTEKAKLAMVITYFISPIDLIPEAIFGPLGYLDDLSLTAWVLKSLMSCVPETVIDELYPGEGRAGDKIQKVIVNADKLVGSGIWKKIQNYINKKETK